MSAVPKKQSTHFNNEFTVVILGRLQAWPLLGTQVQYLHHRKCWLAVFILSLRNWAQNTKTALWFVRG